MMELESPRHRNGEEHLSYTAKRIKQRSAESEEFRTAYEAEKLRFQLLDLRQKSKLTQAEIAKRMGVSQPRVAEIESLSGDLRVETLIAYAQALGMRLELVRDSSAPGS